MLRAGCPRVTHPFAARTPPPKWRASLDLHVLSTPPAFVLSQDQTLRLCLLTATPARGGSSTLGNDHGVTAGPPRRGEAPDRIPSRRLQCRRHLALTFSTL